MIDVIPLLLQMPQLLFQAFPFKVKCMNKGIAKLSVKGGGGGGGGTRGCTIVFCFDKNIAYLSSLII